MEFVFLEPLTRLYSGRTPALRALNSLKKNEQPPSSFVIPAFSVLLNGIEALGSFLTASGSSQVRFYAFVETYMESWDTTVAKSPYATSNDLKEILWKHFRNGIAHGFCIERGGIDNEADADRRAREEQRRRARRAACDPEEVGPCACGDDHRARSTISCEPSSRTITPP